MKASVLRPILLSVSFTMMASGLLSACIGGNGFGVFGFDPVDEDFDRPSPTVDAEGALRRGCEGEPFVQEEVFEHALCLCGDMKEVGQGLITRSTSNLKGRDPGFGHVGVNGSIEVVGNFDVGGALDVAGGIKGVGRLGVSRDLISGDNVEVSGSWDVGGDAWIDGDLRGIGALDIGGDLFLTGDFKAIGAVDFDKGRRGFTYRGAPCGCDAETLLDVPAEVARRKAQNDNESVPGGVGAAELVLEDGEFFFDNPGDLVGARSVVIRGRVALFVEGDIETVGDLNIELEEGSELELWVSGTVRTVGNLRLAAGDNTNPRAFRLYMGGAGEAVVNVGNASFVGAIYAPQVDIEYVGNLEVRGSLFANNLTGTGNLTIEYDTDVSAPDECVDEFFQSQE